LLAKFFAVFFTKGFSHALMHLDITSPIFSIFYLKPRLSNMELPAVELLLL